VTMLRSVVLGCGSYLPSRVLSNADLSRMVDTSDEWIMQRTGIRERRIARDDEARDRTASRPSCHTHAGHPVIPDIKCAKAMRPR